MILFGIFYLILPLIGRCQESIESSGDIATMTMIDITAEPPSSGDMPTELSLDTMKGNGSIDELSTNEFLNGLDTRSENSTMDEQNTNLTATELATSMNVTTTYTEPKTTFPATTTTSEATTTTVVTTPAPTTESVIMTTTTELPSTTTSTTTTTTISTTKMPTTTTSTTTTTTTRKPKTTSARPMTTSKAIHRASISTASSKLDAPCEIIEDDFTCDVEISCFGEGTIDCDDYEEIDDHVEENQDNQKPSSEDISDEYTEEEEGTDDGQIEYFPPELVGKAPSNSKFPLIWKMKSIIDSDNSSSTDSPTTLVTEASTDSVPETTTAAAVTTDAPSVAPDASTTDSVTSTSQKTDDQSVGLLNMSSTAIETSSSPMATTDVQDVNDTTPTTEQVLSILIDGVSNVSDSNVSSSPSPSVNDSDYTTILTSSSSSPQPRVIETETAAVTTPKTLMTTEAPRVITSKRKRRKRESSGFHSESSSSSESLQLASQKSKNTARSCKVSGNLQCTPMPNTVFCKGKATCRMVSIERSEKSATARGVENWAIAVIVICASAALLTIGLLVYLVVTSWKKLKVQPQNGVTTLTYVNSTPP